MNTIITIIFLIEFGLIYSSPVSTSNFSSKIINGNTTIKHEYPFMCSLQEQFFNKKFKHYCGASILSDRWALTAAHCLWIKNPELMYIIWCGRWDIINYEYYGYDRIVKKTIQHPSYEFPSIEYDIGLILIVDTFIWTDYIKPISLPNKNFGYPLGEAKMLGWGAIQSYPNEVFAEKLQEANIPIIPMVECKKIIGSSLPDRSICVGTIEGEISICNLDSGGPLIQKIQNNWILIGIASSINKFPCGSPGGISLFSATSEYIDWIEEATIIEEN